MREWYEREQHLITEKHDNTILEMEMNLIPVLARMEEHGIMVDREKLRDIGSRLSRDITRIEEEVYDLVGERINLSSPKQIVELFERLQIPLLKKNKTGFSVDTDVLEGLA
jgi:DNA polymerase-1